MTRRDIYRALIKLQQWNNVVVVCKDNVFVLFWFFFISICLAVIIVRISLGPLFFHIFIGKQNEYKWEDEEDTAWEGWGGFYTTAWTICLYSSQSDKGTYATQEPLNDVDCVENIDAVTKHVLCICKTVCLCETFFAQIVIRLLPPCTMAILRQVLCGKNLFNTPNVDSSTFFSCSFQWPQMS